MACNIFLAVALAASGCGGCRPGPDRPEDVLVLAGDPTVSARSRLRALARHEDPAIRAAALHGLAEVRARGAIRIARRALRDPDGGVRAVAIAGIERLQDRGSVGELQKLVGQDEDWRVRLRAVEAIAALAGGGAGPLLRGALGDPVAVVRRAAARSLAGHHDPGIEVDLVRALSREGSWSVRVELVRALGRTSGAPGRTALEAALRDGNEFVRIAAQVALEDRPRPPVPRPVVRARISPARPTEESAPVEEADQPADEQEPVEQEDQEDQEEPPPPPETTDGV